MRIIFFDSNRNIKFRCSLSWQFLSRLCAASALHRPHHHLLLLHRTTNVVLTPLFASLPARARPHCRKKLFHLKLRNRRRRRLRPQKTSISVLPPIPGPGFRSRGRDTYRFPSQNYWTPSSPQCSLRKRRPVNFFLSPSN